MRRISLRYYTIPEYEEEQEYLTKMHRKGWKFVKYVFPCFYVFEKCEPENVIYQLDYNEEGLVNRDTYYQMYRDCGWEHLCDVLGYSYFRKPASDKSEEDAIFSDEGSKLDMINRVYTGRMVPCLILFFVIICPQLVIQFMGTTLVNHIVFGIYVVIFLIYVVMFYKFYNKRRKIRKRLYR